MAISLIECKLGADGSGTTSTTVALAFTSPLPSGAAAMGMVSWGDGTITCTGVSDDKGNTYTRLDALANAGAGQSAVQFYKEGITNAPQTITATFSATVGFRRIVIAAYSGIAPAAAIDGHNGTVQNGPGAGANTLNSGSATTTAAGDLIFSTTVDATGSGNTLSAGTSPNAFTQRANGTSTDLVDMLAQDFIQGAAGSIAGTAGCTTGTDSFTTYMMAFKAAISGVVPALARPIIFKPFTLAPFLNRLPPTTSPPPPFVPLTIAPLVKPPIIFNPFSKAPFLNRLPPPGAFTTTLTAALSGLAAIQVKAAAAATNQLAAAARSEIQIKASAAARATVPLASAAEIQVKAAGGLAGATAMTGRTAVQIKEAASVQGAAALAARATTMLKAVAGPSGTVTLSGLAAVMVKAAGGITTGSFVALAGRAAVMVKASAAATGQAALSARATTMTKASAAATGATAMAGQAAFMVKAAGAVTTGALVALSARCTVMVKAAAQQAQATVLAAHLTLQVKAQSPAPVPTPAAGQFQLITSMAGFFNPGSSAIP